MKKQLYSLLIVVMSMLLLAQPIGAEVQSSINEEIIYNILVDRFNNGDPTIDDQVDITEPYTYHGGDFKGIVMKLDHIKKLGFTTISISSIFENAPKGYQGYWIENHYDVEEEFGTIDDFNELIEEAHKRDLKVVMEFVVNYVSPSHPFTQEAEKAAWFQESTLASMNESTAWLDDVVQFDQSHPDVQQYLMDVAEYWMTETDVDGFKIHAADQADIAFLLELAEYIKLLKAEFYLIASVLDLDSNQVDLLMDNPHFDAVEHPGMYKLQNDVFSEVEKPVDVLYEQWEQAYDQTFLLFVDNQNTARFTYNYGSQFRNDITAWRLALAYLYTSPGVPSIYQGSELAMSGQGFPQNQYLVLFNNANPDLEEVYEKMAALRSQFLPIIAYGDYELIDSDGAMTVIKRHYEGESIYVAINNDSVTRSVTIPGLTSAQQLRGLLGDDLVRENQHGEFRIGVERETVELYVVEENVGLNWRFIGFVVGVILLFIIGVNYLSFKQRRREKSQ